MSIQESYERCSSVFSDVNGGVVHLKRDNFSAAPSGVHWYWRVQNLMRYEPLILQLSQSINQNTPASPTVPGEPDMPCSISLLVFSLLGVERAKI